MIAAIAVSALMALIVILVPPVRDAFNLVAMDGKHWIVVILMALSPLVVVELFKLFRINGVKSDME